VIDGGVMAARGFACGVADAGLRSAGGDDVAMLATQTGLASAAATFTTNRFRAAPVIVAAEMLERSAGRVRGIVVNAGCANAGTGPAGIDDARAVVAAAARRLGCGPHEVLPASTGLIGSRLPVRRIRTALAGMALDAGADRAARAIMTTDTRPKLAATSVQLADGRSIRLGGMAKGSGMIHPQMATMLAFLTTDAPVSPGDLAAFLRPSVELTFNQVSVDGDTSTNDCVVLLAGGAAGGEQVRPGTADGDAFADALLAVGTALAMQVAADGEGAQHLIEVNVAGAPDAAGARHVARTVAASSLVKAAVHGADPNWGRIAAAAGRAGVAIAMERLHIAIGAVPVFAGQPCPFDQQAATRELRGATVRLELDLGIGQGRGTAWGCDLSAEYVAINSEYST